MKKRIFAALALSVFALQTSQAEVKLGSIWGDGMVLQRSADILFSGESDGSDVTITTSWSGKKKYKAAVSKDGSWSVEIPTPDADHKAHTITIDDGDRLTLSDVLLGDVWLCLGQSNMQMPMKGFIYQPTEGKTNIIATAKPSREIRMFTAKVTPMSTPQKDVVGEWRLNTPAAVGDFSATGYFFANMVESVVDVPLGMVAVNRGATTIETWMSRESLAESGINKVYELPKNNKFTTRTPMAHYNGMMAPLKGLSVKGALFYQGEANRMNQADYPYLFPKFVEQLRSEFRGGEFPFYYVQIAPFAGPKGDKYEFVTMRETQAKLLDKTPRIGMATLTDAGEEHIIHPRRKRLAGERLALWALADTYGVEGFEPRVAEFKGAVAKIDPQVRKRGLDLKFDYAPNGLHFNENSTSKLFEVAGADGVFYPAEAKLINRNGAFVFVWSDKVAEPKDVRYAFRNYVKGDLFTSYGLPVSSFRSDSYTLSLE